MVGYALYARSHAQDEKLLLPHFTDKKAKVPESKCLSQGHTQELRSDLEFNGLMTRVLFSRSLLVRAPELWVRP